MFQKCFQKISQGIDLTQEESEFCMVKILGGKVSDILLAGFLSSYNLKGVTVDELTGFALSMRSFGVQVYHSNPQLVDTCGTGGDNLKTFNISTAAAIIASSCGVKVAKHGNRSITSKCGGADILEAMGYNIECDEQAVVRCLEESGMGFMFAPYYHPALARVMSVRRELGVPTVFNLLGPLCSPARADIQLLGVFNPDMVPIMAKVLKNLGLKRAMVVHGFDAHDKPAMDEISTIGRTRIALLENNKITIQDICPEDLEIKRANPEDLKAPETLDGHLRVMKDVISGLDKDNGAAARLDLALVNAAAILFLTGTSSDLKKGLIMAHASVKSGKAKKNLDKIIKSSWDKKT